MRTFNVSLKFANAKNLSEGISGDLEAALSAMAEGLAESTYNMGVQYAESKLRSTKIDYLNNFHYKKLDQNNHLIYLDKSVNHIEDGYQGFDMKPGILKGPKARISKHGFKYAIIPFRNRTQESATNLSESYRGQQIQQALKNGTKRGQRVDLRRLQKDASGRPKEGNVGTIGKNPTVHPYLQNLVKVQKTYGKTTSSQLMTYRTVSDRSKPSSWWHPGFEGIHNFQKMAAFIDNEINRFINEFDPKWL